MYRNLLLVVHIAAAGSWVGATFVQLMLVPYFANTVGTARLEWAKASRLLGQRFYTAAGGLLGVTGVLLVIETHWNFSAGFVMVGIAVIIFGALMGALVFAKLADREIAALGAEPSDLTTANAVRQRIIGFALLDTTLVLLAMLTMIDKWKA